MAKLTEDIEIYDIEILDGVIQSYVIITDYHKKEHPILLMEYEAFDSLVIDYLELKRMKELTEIDDEYETN